MPTECFRFFLWLFSALILQVKIHGPSYTRLHAPWPVLCREAEFLKIKVPTKTVRSGSTCSKCSVPHRYCAHHCSIQHSKNGVTIDCDRRKMQFVRPVFWIVSSVVFYQSYKLKEERGFGSRLSTVWRKLNQPFQPKVPHQDQESTKFLSHCFSRDKLHLWDSHTFLLWA